MSAQRNQQYAAPYQQYQTPYQQYQQYQQPSATAPSSNVLAQLKALGQLRESGILTEEEFQVQKQKILNGF
jgi:hypothetical protein